MIRRHPVLSAAVLALVVVAAGCAALGDYVAALSSLARVQFKLGAVRDFRLVGIPIERISRLRQLSALDALKLVQAFATKRFPADFILDVDARNPNPAEREGKPLPVTISGLESRLLIDDTPTVTGNIDGSVPVPGQQEVIIPIRFGLDLYQFFGERGYEGVVNLALAIGGARAEPTRVALDAKPTVTTPYGSIQYPGRLTIVSREFRSGGN